MPNNIYSLKLLKKVGFIEEGLLRMYDFGKEFKDTIMLSILSFDYRSSKESLNPE